MIQRPSPGRRVPRGWWLAVAVATLLAGLTGIGALPLAARAAAPAPRRQVVLPDTGLFAPVARQHQDRLAWLLRTPQTPASPERIEALLADGNLTEADEAMEQLQTDPRTGALLHARLALLKQDFETLEPLVARIAAQPVPTPRERQILLAWAYARDDGAALDSMTRAPAAGIADRLAAGRLAYDLLQYPRADSCFRAVLAETKPPQIVDANHSAFLRAARAEALAGLGRVLLRLRDYDGSLARLVESIQLEATADALESLSQTLIRLGRTDEAISACEWAVRLDPYHELAHYALGNGYARLNYSELLAAYPESFADTLGRRALARGDSLLAAGDSQLARAAYQAVRAAHPGWADASARLASLAFEEEQPELARGLAFEALVACPEYGRAHAILAKALEQQRFQIDVHRPAYEARFAALPMPRIPGLDTFVLNWKSLSTRHQKRVALSIAPWRAFLPVLVAGGASFYIKPLYMRLSETPYGETLRDQRINYDSRLWDDVRGAGGYHTVTGIEDVERTIFDRYNTVLHELSHQVHAVLTADQSREIESLYQRAKTRDDSTRNGYLSRYAGGSVYEYFAEGANALGSPKRDAYDPREVVRERLETIDPDLLALERRLMAQKDVSASLPVAYANAGDDRVERGAVDEAIGWYRKGLAKGPKNETVLVSLVRAETYANHGPAAVAEAEQALALRPASGPLAAAAAEALWHGGRGLDASITTLERSRTRVGTGDRHYVDLELSRLWWVKGDAPKALAAADSVLAWQSDQPEGLWQRAAALGLAKRWDDAFPAYDRAVRMRTGVADLRCDYARDLLRAGRPELARAQLAEAALLDAENPEAEGLRGWVELATGRPDSAQAHCERALRWGPWCDLARLVAARAASAAHRDQAATAALSSLRSQTGAAPIYVYRPKLATWEAAHEWPAVERELLEAKADSGAR